PGTSAGVSNKAAEPKAATNTVASTIGTDTGSASEAALAPNVDPFFAANSAAQARQSLPVVQRTQPSNVATDTKGTRKLQQQGGETTQILPLPVNGPKIVAEIPVPELVGTLLGDLPTAVFKTEKQLQTVPV